MKFIFSPDSFKGTMTSIEVIEILEKKAKEHFPGCEVVKIPIADGGEGTVESLVMGCNGTEVSMKVKDPEGNQIEAIYGVINKDTAIIEMAQASGLTLVKGEKNPLYTTSYGTGEMIVHAMEQGYRKLTIGIGGSATNDGGLGALMALGVKFYDASGQLINDGNGFNLRHVAKVDNSELNPLVKECEVKVICDVSNPLLGDQGATYIYGPQKGGTPDRLIELEAGMKNFVEIIKKDLGLSFEDTPGAGAAGGLGYAFITFMNAELVRGIDAVLDLVQFEKLLQDVDLVVTGEGNMDRQTASYGKVPVGVAERCKKHNVPVVAVVGGLADGIDDIYETGLSAIVPVVTRAMPLEEVLANAKDILENATDRMFRTIKVGMQMK